MLCKSRFTAIIVMPPRLRITVSNGPAKLFKLTAVAPFIQPKWMVAQLWESTCQCALLAWSGARASVSQGLVSASLRHRSDK